MGACETVCKVFLVLINLLVGLIGLVLIAAGAFIKLGSAYIQPLLNQVTAALPDIQNAVQIADGATQSPGSDPGSDLAAQILGILDGVAIGLIIVGVLIFVTSLLGCIGACCTVKVMLIIYVVIVGIIFLGELIVVIIFFTGTFDPQIRNSINSTMVENYGGIDSFDLWSLLYNFLMINFKCCGIDGYEDFYYTPNWKRHRSFTQDGYTVNYTMVTPVACCKMTNFQPDDTNCTIAPTDVNNNWKTGCYNHIATEFRAFEGALIGAAAGSLVFLAILLALAILILVLSGREKVGVV